jgi:hypothetical protein
MFALSTPQFDQFSDQVRERARERMVAHVTHHFPLPARLAGPDAVGQLVDDCFAEAGPLGLHRECDLTFLMSLKLYFGAGFRTDRQCEPFAAILAREDVATPEARIGRCWREGMAHHDAIAGEDGRHHDAAIIRLAGRGLARLAADDSPLDSAKAQALLADVWPEKAAWMARHDPTAAAGLMAQVSALAKTRGIATRGAARLLLLSCWVFGSGFATDPMLGRLAQLLSSDPPLGPPALAAADAFLAQICQHGA